MKRSPCKATLLLSLGLALAMPSFSLSQGAMAQAKSSASASPSSLSSSTLTLSSLPASTPSLFSTRSATASQVSKARVSRKSKIAGDAHIDQATALDKTTVDIINMGDWKALAAHLKEKLQSKNKGTADKKLSAKDAVKRSYLQAWLAFAYMFNSDKENSQALLATVDKERPALADLKTTDDATIYANAKVVEAFAQIARGKAGYAESILKDLPTALSDHFTALGKKAPLNSAPQISSITTVALPPAPATFLPAITQDALYNFALAAVSGKKAQPQRAIEYAYYAVKSWPQFAWGLRTVGYLKYHWLKDNTGAEDALTEALTLEPRQKEVRDMLIDVKLMRNDYDGAEALALKALALEPKSAANNFKLAQLYTLQWRLNEALTQLDKAIAKDPNVAKYYRTRSNVHKLRHELEAAVADQSKAVELSNDKAFELAELANLNVYAGNKNKAIDNLKSALALDPKNDAARERLFNLLFEEKRYEDLATEYKIQIARNPNYGDLHLGLAAILMQLNHDKEAVDEFNEAARLNPMDPNAFRQLGAFYITRKNYEEAAKQYTKALNVMPTSVKDLVALGYCYAEADDYTQAEAAFVTALALQQIAPSNTEDEPSRIDIMRSLGYLYFDEGRYSEACTQFQNLIAVFKEVGVTWEDYLHMFEARLLRDASKDDADAALCLETFKKLNPESQVLSRPSLIEALLDSGKLAAARQLLDGVSADEQAKNGFYKLYACKLKRLKGESAAVVAEAAELKALSEKVKADDAALASRLWVELALSQLETGDTKSSAASANKALELYGKNFAAYLALAKAQMADGKFAEAEDSCAKAAKLNIYFAQTYFVQGQVQLKAGKNKEGIESLKRACELYPGFREAHKLLLVTYKQLAMDKDAKVEESLLTRMEGKRGTGR